MRKNREVKKNDIIIRAIKNKKPQKNKEVKKKDMIMRLKDVKKQKRWGVYKNNFRRISTQGQIGFYPNPLGPFHNIKDFWKNEICFVIGASTAIRGFDLKKLEGYHTITMNHLIEQWDGAEWHLVLDDRFFNKTTYEMRKYKGRLFLGNRCRMHKENDVVRFCQKPRNLQPSLDIEQGLWGVLSGACAINLALISGAKKIYLLGLDDSKEFIEKALKEENIDYHNTKDYTAEIKTSKYYEKYVNSRKGYQKFLPWKNKIVDVCENGQMDWFNQISLEQFENEIINIKKKPKIEVNKTMTICHVQAMDSIDSMGDISRYIYSDCEGNHITSNIRSIEQPKADIYLLDCMLNQFDKFINFQKPKGSKVVSIVHTSGRCMPAICSDRIVVINSFWKQYLKQHFDERIINVIFAGVDATKYNKKINYSNQIFGRLTRWSPGKVHPEWNNMMLRILNNNPDSKAIMISNNVRQRVRHDRLEYIENIQQTDIEKKIEALSKLSIFADMHNTFIETASLCLLQAMASGLCIVLFSTSEQPAMKEYLGDAGIICDTKKEFENTLNEILPDTKIKAFYGLKAKERVNQFSIKRMIDDYNKLFQEVLK